MKLAFTFIFSNLSFAVCCNEYLDYCDDMEENLGIMRNH